MIHLDTSFLILALAPGTDEDLAMRRWLARRTPLIMSSIAWAEFLCGAPGRVIPHEARALLRTIAPVGDAEASVAARLFNASGRRRGSLADCLVAACAVTAGAPLATSNRRDFERLGIALA